MKADIFEVNDDHIKQEMEQLLLCITNSMTEGALQRVALQSRLSYTETA